MEFDEHNIQALFGHEAAEDEVPSRLRQYYFKTSIYDNVIAGLPLRLLVGHKGIGKSALFQVAMAEDHQNERMALVIRPDDVLDIAEGDQDFLRSIRVWKQGLLELLTTKALTSLGYGGDDVKSRLAAFAVRSWSYCGTP